MKSAQRVGCASISLSLYGVWAKTKTSSPLSFLGLSYQRPLLVAELSSVAETHGDWEGGPHGPMVRLAIQHSVHSTVDMALPKLLMAASTRTTHNNLWLWHSIHSAVVIGNQLSCRQATGQCPIGNKANAWHTGHWRPTHCQEKNRLEDLWKE